MSTDNADIVKPPPAGIGGKVLQELQEIKVGPAKLQPGEKPPVPDKGPKISNTRIADYYDKAGQRSLDELYRERSSNYNIPTPRKLIKKGKELTDTDLVDQLGAPTYVLREEAAGILDSMDKAALPSLKAGLDSRDPEIRSRAGSLRAKIELRDTLTSTRDLIKTDEALNPPPGEPSPDNWSKLCDQFLEKVGKVDRETLSRVNDRFGPQDELFSKLDVWNSLEQKDLARLAQITRSPVLECARALVHNHSTDLEQQFAQMDKVTKLLTQELKIGSSKFNDRDLLALAQQSGAMQDDLFLTTWQEKLAKIDPQYQSASPDQVRNKFREMLGPRRSNLIEQAAEQIAN